jgi:cytochrome b involved in lipid metabolism
MPIKISLLVALLGTLAVSCDRKESSNEASQRPTAESPVSAEPSADQNLSIPRQEQVPNQPLNDSTRDSEATYTAAEVALHSSKTDCWIIIEDSVYDITNFFEDHPGGEAPVRFCGKDATAVFSRIHAGSADASTMSQNYRIGRLIR